MHKNIYKLMNKNICIKTFIQMHLCFCYASKMENKCFIYKHLLENDRCTHFVQKYEFMFSLKSSLNSAVKKLLLLLLLINYKMKCGINNSFVDPLYVFMIGNA